MIEFVQNEQVIVHSLGDSCPGEFRAKVVGVAAQYPEVTFYILEMIDPIPGQIWTHCMMIGSCIKKAHSMVENCQKIKTTGDYYRSIGRSVLPSVIGKKPVSGQYW